MEQAFGILKGRWRIMDGPCKVNHPVLVRKVAMVCCALQTFVRGISALRTRLAARGKCIRSHNISQFASINSSWSGFLLNNIPVDI